MIYPLRRLVKGKVAENFRNLSQTRGVVALNPPTSKTWKVIVAILFILTGIGEIVTIVKQDALAQKRDNEKKGAIEGLRVAFQASQVQNAGDLGYMKGKLDEALSRKTPNIGDLGSAIAKSSAELIRHESQAMSDQQLSESAISLAQKMRTLEAQYHSKEYGLSMGTPYNPNATEAEKTAAFNQSVMQTIQLSEQEKEQFKNEFLGQAIYLRDELKNRLSSVAPPQPSDLIAFDGILAGPDPISEAANYLELLARRLSPNLPKKK